MAPALRPISPPAAARRARGDQSLEQVAQRDHIHRDLASAARPGRLDVSADHEVDAGGIATSKRPEMRGIELAGRTLALDRRGRLAAGGDDEIHLVAVLAPPVMDRRPPEVSLQLVEDEVLPEPS